jgi:NADP-dependent 3-hydroxy acid dehydrogenase YdfG
MNDKKVWLVTGAGRGLGVDIAKAALAAGHAVVATGRNPEKLSGAIGEHVDLLAVKLDVTDPTDAEAAVAAAIDRFGRIDVLINNAGVMPLSPLEKLKVDEWDRMIDVNIKGVLYGIAAALPHMQRQKAGHIINVSSVAGHKVGPTFAVYSATKHAVRTLSEGLRMEVKPHNIRTTIISPGAVTTELLDGISDPEVAAANRAYVAKVAVPADSFARAVAFAISQPAELDINEILFRPTNQEF